MELDERIDENVQDSSVTSLQGCFFALFGVLRAVAIVASLAFVGTGAYLGYELFYFLKEIVHDPTAIVREWQVAVQEDEGDGAGVPVAAEAPLAAEAPVAEVPVLAERLPAADTKASATTESVAGAEVEAGVAVADGDQPDAPGATPGPVDTDSAEVVETMPAPVVQSEIRSVPREEPNPWVVLGERLLDQLEAGEVNWLVGLLMLVIFCWLLVKIPVLMISTGGKVLVDLFKLGRENK